MEDAHTIALSLDQDQGESNTFFAVYDGHGGYGASQFSGERVHQHLVATDAYRNKEYIAALKSAFLETDEDMRTSSNYRRDGSGCTAVAALVTTEGKLYVANAGDSRSVLSNKGEVVPLSFDHKPQNESNLALARALGDFDYKRNKELPPEAQIITADPEITERDITDDDEFFVVACDGIWDCLSSQQVIDVVRRLVARGKELQEICEEICELCLAPDTNGGAGIGTDNMTILIVAMLHGRTIEEWYSWVKQRVDKGYGYHTPQDLPPIYSQVRLSAFRRRREVWEKRRREPKALAGEPDDSSWLKAYILDADGTITPDYRFMPRPTALNQSQIDNSQPPNNNESDGKTIQQEEDAESTSSDETIRPGEGDIEDEDETEADRQRVRDIRSQDATQSLRQQVDELERDEMDQDMAQISSKGASTLQGEAPPPPKPSGNNGPEIKQFESLPGGDAPSDAVKAEGLIDSSEGPFKL
ncbi:uncharacterized protein FIBRA_05671 [Fibroporia radiculosa]|uniref:protein-serine/threonine phosphatase n=1 Tax=Fibroporia radiculosa TaxID=599839 RepID=J4HXX6_9APHY|nr:uncharacterized protein FIBRA_05671 [Fibroporia radiculosa]CCM03537.1 predicted protein [Fibroporia radiculosa]